MMLSASQTDTILCPIMILVTFLRVLIPFNIFLSESIFLNAKSPAVFLYCRQEGGTDQWIYKKIAEDTKGRKRTGKEV